MPSRRLLLIGFAAVAAIGLAGLALAAFTTKSSTVQSLGVAPIYAVAPLHPQGGTVCESPIAVADPITQIRFNAGTNGQPGVPLEVRVNHPGGVPIARAEIAGGWIDNGTPQTARVARVAAEQYVQICISNRGTRWAFIFGDLGVSPAGVLTPSGPRPTVTPAKATVDGYGLQGDISMSFVSDHQRSLVSRIPEIFDRATAFRPGFVGAWTYWLLLLGVLVAAPLLVVRAGRAACDEEEPSAAPGGDGGNGRVEQPAATVGPLREPENTAASGRGSRD